MIESGLTILGNRVQGSLETVETFAAPAPAGIVGVTMTSDEVVSHCPVTGQKDFYTVSIMYTPDGRCIESKSLKLYLDHFMMQGIFAETLATTICNDLFNACQPLSCVVVVRQKSRGGIVIEVQAEKHAPPQDIEPQSRHKNSYAGSYVPTRVAFCSRQRSVICQDLKPSLL